ncbi:hypothetical protein SAMN05421777_13311 [Fluoribacter gormanii]|uniref:Uncharacterized protein n=1 Tax=Fluoribacter gormanii TaxID=464 RepID=A0A377GJZ9_9GAMM|nr:hypothetical protein SAMN05421777_13311 [Fluoribacter gormanii]STO25149.1 Uncharacterised protein [Fluoribacter gormanii]
MYYAEFTPLYKELQLTVKKEEEQVLRLDIGNTGFY